MNRILLATMTAGRTGLRWLRTLKKGQPLWSAVLMMAAVTLSAITVAIAASGFHGDDKSNLVAANDSGNVSVLPEQREETSQSQVGDAVATPRSVTSKSDVGLRPQNLNQSAVASTTITVNSTAEVKSSGTITVLDYHGNIALVKTLLDQLAQQNGWSVTHVSPSAFASMTSNQIQSFNVLFTVSGSAANNPCGTGQWGGSPDYSGLLSNLNVGVATANGRKVITGLDPDWHGIFFPVDISRKLLANAINWAGSGPSTGYVVLSDGNNCSEWWTLTGSFLLPLFTAPGVSVIYEDYMDATIVDPTHPVVQGLPSVIHYCCHHTRISGPIPGFTTLMIDPGTGLAATLVSEPPTELIVIKHVINDNGGTAVASDFTMTVTGNSPSPASFPGAESPGTTVMLDAGNYSVTETVLSGYTATLSTGCIGSIAVSQTITCTITNNDQTAHLKLAKEMTNDNGGTAVPTDFNLSASGPTPISGPGGAEGDVNAGTYNLSETGPSGYTASAWSCEGGSQSGSSITLALGQSATCTITNDDQTAHLKLVKEVTNDNGGTAVPTDFNLSAAGPTPISGPGGVESDVNAGTHTLSETGPSGYTASAWVCIGGTQSGSQITLALGQSATCTITNDDIPKPPIKVTGGGQIPVPDPTSSGRATFGFIAQQKVEDGIATGHFNYLNHDTGLHVNGPVNDIRVIATNPDGSPKTVQFSGTCDGSGPACSFIVTVEDHGEPGTSDEFGITVTGGLTETRSQRVISRGNIQFHTP